MASHVRVARSIQPEQTAGFRYRFRNNSGLQELSEGQRVTVLHLSLANEPVWKERKELLF